MWRNLGCANSQAGGTVLNALLRLCRERPRRRAAEQRDELAPFFHKWKAG